MIRKILLASSLILSFAFASTVFADSHDDNGNTNQCMCMRMQDMLKKLDLSDDQKSKIQDIMQQSAGKMQENMNEMKAVNAQIMDLIKADKMDESKLDALVKQKTDIMANMMKTKIRMKNQMFNVFNAQQRDKCADMMAKWQEKKMKFMQPMNMEMDND